MTLEFHKLTHQIEEFSAYLAASDLENASKVDLALKIWRQYADPTRIDEIHARVAAVVERDLGYRGATAFDEPILHTYPPSPLPGTATLVAADGSQIVPDPHQALLFYLINIGVITLKYGSGLPPDIESRPRIHYDDADLFSDFGLISSDVVDARRTIEELTALAETSESFWSEGVPVISLVDGPLLVILKATTPDRENLKRHYLSAMDRMRDIEANLAGYTDRPRSAFILNLLQLLSLPEDNITEANLRDANIFRFLTDIQVLNKILPPNHRSALFIQMSPMNKEFRLLGGDDFEIAFFYLNVADVGERPSIARVELPVWVARNKENVAKLQAILIDQCRQTGLRYPYALTRADEIAVVRRDEAKQLLILLQTALARGDMYRQSSAKLSSKAAARYASQDRKR